MTPNTFDFGNLWDTAFFQPQPSQDSDLLNLLGFVPGLKALLMLRQVHALEHATVWVLSEQSQACRNDLNFSSQPDNDTLGGLSTENGFYLYGEVDRLDLQRAIHQALQRCRQGEWQLAIHPRCGTNVSVNLMLTATFAIAAHLILPRNPIEQLLGVGIAATTAAQLSPDLGLSVQKYLTTAIPFNLLLVDITTTQDFWQRPAYFVKVCWQDLQ